jgi:hypothetical protein
MIKRKNQKPYVIAFRCTKGEKTIIDIMASRENMSNSDLIRLLIREGAERRGFNPLGLINLPTLKKEGINE